MIHKKLILAGFLGCMMSFSAYAQGNKPCRVFEFEELKTFSDTELSEMRHNYATIAKQIGTITPTTPREVQEDFFDQKNCTDEAERIRRILDSRAQARPPGVKPKKKG